MLEQHGMSRALRTKAIEDLLKAVYLLQRRQTSVSIEAAADELGQELPVVTEMVEKLAAHGLLSALTPAAFRLTEAGERLALELTLRTEAVEDFLKTVYLLQRQHDPVPTTVLANELGVKPPSVTEMTKKLAEHGLLEYEKYKGVRLTGPGRRIALEVVRHHRLLEVYLTQALGYSWDEVHEEADRLEHVISEQFEDRIATMLGDPQHDPHGDPIPTANGTVPTRDLVSLVEQALNRPGLVFRITDQSPDVLRYLADLGLVPGAHVVVTAREPFDGPIRLLIEDSEAVIGATVARHVYLAPLNG